MTRFARSLMILFTLLCLAVGATGEDDREARMDRMDRVAVDQLMASPHWPFRVFGLLRAERYDQASVEEQMHAGFGDGVWQVRCFAVAQAHRMGITIDPGAFAGEGNPLVMRTLVRHGVPIDAAVVATGVKKLIRNNQFDLFLIGVEIAAATDDAALRAMATKRLMSFIARLDDRTLAMTSDRLRQLLTPTPVPETAHQWRQWVRARGGRIQLPAAQSQRVAVPAPGRHASPIADLEPETFARLIDYIGSLKQRDVDLVIVMDATASMRPMINQVRAGVDELIQFMNDLSRSMRLGFVAYRDHDHEVPVVQSAPLTANISAIRGYLFELQITGGADYPEAVLDGVKACRHFEWNHRATRQVVIVGDAPPHDRDVQDLSGLLQQAHKAGTTVNTVHVPQFRTDAVYRRMTRAAASADRQFLASYNISTAEAFRSMAELGGGDMTSLKHSGKLVPAIMRFSIDEGWWPVFDAFYEQFVTLCR